MFGVESLCWLRSAVNEVKTTRREQKSEKKIRRGGGKKKKKRRGKEEKKKILGRDVGRTVLQLYLINGTAALI